MRRLRQPGMTPVIVLATIAVCLASLLGACDANTFAPAKANAASSEIEQTGQWTIKCFPIEKGSSVSYLYDSTAVKRPVNHVEGHYSFPEESSGFNTRVPQANCIIQKIVAPK